MTTASTAQVLIGPLGVGPFGDTELWRVNPNSAQLVEGGSSGPYFLTQIDGHEFVIMIESLDREDILRALLFALALMSGDGQSRGLLRDTENLIETDHGERVAPCWEIADDVMIQLARRISPICRVGIVTLDDRSLINPRVQDELRMLGFQVSAFSTCEDTPNLGLPKPDSSAGGLRK